MDYPLKGYRVVDCSWVLAGPNLGRLLADMGAEVIKVETRKHADTVRFSAENIERDAETDPMFHFINRNKLGITVDMGTPEGQAILKKLIKISDIVLENFFPGTMKRYGLDYESLRQENPRLVMISLPGLGSWGPAAATPAYAGTLSGLSGLDSLIGYPGERVLGSQGAFSDYNSAILGFFAVLSALMYRNRTGRGQYIELPQLEGTISCLAEGIMEFNMDGRTLEVQGNRNPVMAPHNNYRCKGEDGWVSIAVKTDEEWNNLCRAIGQPALATDERFADSYRRLKNHVELDKIITEWTQNYTHYEVMHNLQKAGVAAVAVMDVGDRYTDPQYQAREDFLFLPHPKTGDDVMPNVAWKMSETKCPVRHTAPMLGQHNQYVFHELLGMSLEEIASLEERQILY